MFRFYKNILNLKTRLLEQNLKKNSYIFSLSFKPVHLLQNEIENKIHVLQNEYFYRVNYFLTELNFLKRDTNIYFKQITFFFFYKKKRFCKNHTYLFLKNVFFLNLLLIFNSTFEQPHTCSY